MDATYPQTPPAELVFQPQVPFSWTLRWARAHRSQRAKAELRTFRIVGATRDADELSAAIAFAREHDARIELA